MSNVLQIFKLPGCQTHPYIFLLSAFAKLEQPCTNPFVRLEKHLEELAPSRKVVDIDLAKRNRVIENLYFHRVAIF